MTLSHTARTHRHTLDRIPPFNLFSQTLCVAYTHTVHTFEMGRWALRNHKHTSSLMCLLCVPASSWTHRHTQRHIRKCTQVKAELWRRPRRRGRCENRIRHFCVRKLFADEFRVINRHTKKQNENGAHGIESNQPRMNLQLKQISHIYSRWSYRLLRTGFVIYIAIVYVQLCECVCAAQQILRIYGKSRPHHTSTHSHIDTKIWREKIIIILWLSHHCHCRQPPHSRTRTIWRVKVIQK